MTLLVATERKPSSNYLKVKEMNKLVQKISKVTLGTAKPRGSNIVTAHLSLLPPYYQFHHLLLHSVSAFLSIEKHPVSAFLSTSFSHTVCTLSLSQED